MIGRGTWIIRGKLRRANKQYGDGAWVRVLIVKLSWSPRSGKSENILSTNLVANAKVCGDLWVLDRLSNVLHAENIDRTCEEPMEGLVVPLGDRYEPRILRILVLEGLTPITELATALSLSRHL
jgi:hypothetical protein